jgi:hypothetical protein
LRKRRRGCSQENQISKYIDYVTNIKAALKSSDLRAVFDRSERYEPAAFGPEPYALPNTTLPINNISINEIFEKVFTI